MELNMDVLKKSALGIKERVSSKMPDVSAEQMLLWALKTPGVKINREVFLRKELTTYYAKDLVNKAIEYNPASAGITKEAMDKFAKDVISYETNKVTAVSAVAGIPGGVAMAATIPADLAQYFAFMLRVMQKLAYLYGFEDFELKEDNISESTLNELLVFLGVMFGVQEANTGVRVIAELAARNVSKKLAQKALTKGTVYPIVKKVAQAVGVKMTKQVFANGVSKAIPLLSGAISGGLTYATFKPCANRLKKTFQSLPICDPDTYKNIDNEPDTYNAKVTSL